MYVLNVCSDCPSIRQSKNKNLIGFHKHGHILLNKTVQEKTGIKVGMYARFVAVNFNTHKLFIHFTYDKPFEKSYKCFKDKFKKWSYVCVSCTYLYKTYGLKLYGAFNYEYYTYLNGTIGLTIDF